MVYVGIAWAQRCSSVVNACLRFPGTASGFTRSTDFSNHLSKVHQGVRLQQVKYNNIAHHCTRHSKSLTVFLPASLRIVLGTGSLLAVKFISGNAFVYCKDATSSPLLLEDVIKKTKSDKNSEEEDSEQALSEPEFDWCHFWTLLRPQLHFFIGAVATALVVAAANVQIPLLLGDLVNVVAEFASKIPATEAGATAAAARTAAFWDQISGPAAQLIKVYVVQAGFTFAYISCLTLMGERMAVQLRQELFHSLLQQDIAFYDQHKTGELLNRLTADVQDFKSSFKMCVSQGIRSATQIVGCCVSMFTISPSMAGVFTMVLPCVIVLGTSLGNLLRKISLRAQYQVAVSTGVAEECLGNVRTVRSFACEEHEEAKFANELDQSRIINEKLGFGIGLFQAGTSLFLNGVVLSTLWLGGSQLASGAFNAGDLMAFLAASQTIQRSLSQLSVLFGYYVRGISAGTRVFEYVKLTPIIPLKGGIRIPYHTLRGTIEFNNVSFSYPTRPDQEVLTEFSLRVPAGSMVALVGESGAGKTTIGHLLERFYDVDGGFISIDGEDIRALDPAWLRGQLIGFIHQEPVLFASSVMENIRYGRPAATDEEVIEAARTANADGFIRQFPQGYDTLVGERGVTVSGGQKQRIAIARALLNNPRILVLDEATSALDAESERVVQAALEQCSKGRTVLVIAHRLSTIQAADVIAVISRGRVVELGSHEALKKHGGYYAKLIKQQEKK